MRELLNLVRSLESKLKVLQLKIDDRDLDIDIRRSFMQEDAVKIDKLLEYIVFSEKQNEVLKSDLLKSNFETSISRCFLNEKMNEIRILKEDCEDTIRLIGTMDNCEEMIDEPDHVFELLDRSIKENDSLKKML